MIKKWERAARESGSTNDGVEFLYGCGTAER
jgi:hypothetical protein